MRDCKSLIAGTLLVVFSLTGCGKALNPYQENFDCRAPAGDGRCLDTPSAYNEAISEDLDFDLPVSVSATQAETVSRDEQPARQPAGDPRREAQETRYRLLAELLAEPQAPLLEPPRVLRVLLLPYRGQGDELFMARHVFIKVEEARWVLTDIEEKQ